nr:unnamed protein product [Digitaria exilis]
MDAVLSAIISDLLSRALSMVIQRYKRSRAEKAAEHKLQRLHRVLLRIDATVEAADQRHITNQAMLRQLEMLRRAMYAGHYMLDTLKYRSGHGDGDEQVSAGLPVALPRFISGKRLPVSMNSNRNLQNIMLDTESLNKLEKTIDDLEALMADTLEFTVFLDGYPRICRQPYSTYLILGNVMFGRQMEMEMVINFLLRPESLAGNGNPGVLPIVGVARIGKSTLVEHICRDERVRGHFSSIVVFTGEDLDAVDIAAFRGSAVIKHQDVTAASPSHGGRSLAVIELAGDIDEEAWRRMYYSAASSMGHGSKIVITSRSEKIAALGTTKALILKALPQEAYWYFFKALAFWSTNADDRPKLASLGMEISEFLEGSFLAGNVVGSLMRANQNTEFWLRVLKRLRNCTRKHILRFGEHPTRLLQQGRPVYPWRMHRAQDTVTIICNIYQKPYHQEDVPEVTFGDILSGRSTHQGKFSALAWRSTIPPYYTYLANCASQTPVCSTVNKKRPRQARV